MYKQSKTIQEYLDQRVDYNPSTGCLEWVKGKDRDGYGQCHGSRIAKQHGVTRAHQLAYIDFFGPYNKSLFVCHKCDNPSCVTPTHLFLGTAHDNNHDMIQKGRAKSGGAPRKVSYTDVVADWGSLDCFQTAEKYNISFSMVCNIWRQHGKTGKKKGYKRSLSQKQRQSAPAESSQEAAGEVPTTGAG